MALKKGRHRALEEIRLARQRRKEERRQRKTILDRILGIWEDKCYYFNLGTKLRRRLGDKVAFTSTVTGLPTTETICPLQGPIVNWQHFREALLDCLPSKKVSGGQEFLEFDCDRFVGNDRVQQHFGPHGCLGDIPQFIWDWTCSSRRIYVLRPEIQLILAATSLHKVKWGEISLPFDSFALELAQPLVDAKGKEFSFVLISKRREGSEAKVPDNKAKGTIHLFLVSKEVASYAPVTVSQREKIELAMSRRDWRTAVRFMNEMNDRLIGTEFTSIDFDIGISFNCCIEDQPDSITGSAKYFESTQPLWKSLLRICLGLGLYLKNLPSGSSCVSDWTPYEPGTKDDLRAVSHSADVCLIDNCYALSRDERVMLGLESPTNGQGREVSCHWREGYWRRLPGLGQDASAKKTVHVRPTLVRRDRLKKSQLPGGTAKVI